MSPASEVAPRTGQLPIESTGFVGRQAELAALEAALGGSRMVTVTGPGGVGKTRLALRYAAKAKARYRHGVVLAELSALRAPGLLPLAVVSALGLSRPDAPDPLETITGYLRDREMLLILDTCEHLIDECAMLAEAVLRAASGVRILATSRQPLDVPGETTCPLSPLQVPQPGARPAPGDAVELFAQRAAAALAGFRVTDENSEQVIRLCQRLDGIPLAIELAAVRLRALDLADLTRRLDRRLQLLAGGRRGAAPRHQALRDNIGWSYELCTPDERALWARLSVFSGPFTMRAAEETCGGGALPRDTVVDTLISLVDKSVVAREDGLVPCYRMLDTIREYGAERLDATGTADQVRIRMIGHYLRLGEEMDADPLTDQLNRYRTLRAQHDNLRASASYAFAIPGQEKSAARLISVGYWYGLISGEFHEARLWTARVLDLFGDPSAERANGLLLEGILVAAQGRPEDGLAECAEGLAMAAETGASAIHARGHVYYCLALLMAGLPDKVPEVARVADPLLRASGDGPNADVLPLYVALSRFLAGDRDQCLRDAAEGLGRMPGDAGERWASSFLLSLSGAAWFLKGETERGLAAARKSLEMRRELGDPMGMAFCLNVLGVMAANQSRFRRAAWLMGTAAQLWKRLGTRTFIGLEGMVQFAAEAIGQTREAMGEDAYAEATLAALRQPFEETAAMITDDDRGFPGDRAGPAGEPGPGTTATPLTRRESEIATLVAEGLSNRDIAARLAISRRTVDSHVEHIFGKIDVSSRVQLALWVRQQAAP